MLPFLTYPLALIGLVSLPALAAIYMLRNKFRRRRVSSLMLWKLQERPKEGGVKVQQARLPWIFFLELLVLLLLVIAATGPRWQAGMNLRPLVVVLDDSVSMTAVGPDGSPRDRGVARIRDLLNRERFLSIRFVLASSRAKLLGSPVKTAAESERILEAWRCRSVIGDLDAGLALGAELTREDALLLVFTDRPADAVSDVGGRLRWWATGTPGDNVGFVNAARSPAEDKDRVLLEVENFSTNRTSTTLKILAGDGLLRESELKLDGGERRRVVLNIPARSPAIQARLSDDGLLADNEVHLIPPSRMRVRVNVDIGDASVRELVNRTLDATGRRSALEGQPELWIHDRASAAPGTNTWTVQFLSGTNATPLSGPFVVDSSHPVAGGLSLEGTVWAAAELEATPGFLPIVTAGERPLISVRADVLGREQLRINLNPQLSTVPQTPNWPVLIWNLLEWRQSAFPGLRDVNFRPGTEVRIQTRGASVTITGPGGEAEELTVSGGAIAARADEAGLYQVRAAEADWTFSVNLLSAAESNIKTATRGEWGSWESDVEERRQYASVLWLFVLLALAGLVSHHYFITSGKGRL